MRLILIRHGETVCNVEDVWHGWDDCELTPTGIAQAEAVARHLQNERIDAIYCSDSRRAVQTAAALGRTRDLEPVQDAAFRERFAGEYEGLSMDEVIRINPRVWEERSADYWAWRPPRGETFHEVRRRTMEGLERIKARHPSETVALVGHMGTVRVLISALLGIPIEETYEMPFPSTGVSIFSFDGSTVTVEVLNDATHVL